MRCPRQALVKTVDKHRVECDENKCHLLQLWIKVLRGFPGSGAYFVPDAAAATELMDFFICLRPTDPSLEYNKRTLPVPTTTKDAT